MPRERFVKQSLGTPLHTKIKEAKILLVGAGGIGCELLKNLVLTGFGQIHIVDLDTIDLSNLNRQFLFRHEHIKKSKALVAKESASKFNPRVKLEAHHANIKDSHFNIDWFQSFNLVFNALDNLDARRHVNQMCLAAQIPLIESGTTGFNGQVQVIVKGKTECYDCNTKEVPKTFPVCTIRSTPSQPIHCIVWAKSYLFTEIFGTSEDEIPVFDHSEDSDNGMHTSLVDYLKLLTATLASEIENLKTESQALNNIRQSMGSEDFPRKIFDKVFKEDIHRLRSMEDMWKSRKPPNPLDFDALSSVTNGTTSKTTISDQATWSQTENLEVFCDSVDRLSKRLQHAQSTAVNGNSAPHVLSFDKDDDDTLDFVVASANLRSNIFGIESKSKFDIKQMAGNIIPAIATTNAMTAGLCVLQAFKVLRDDLHKARMVFLERSGARVINSDTLKPPNPQCAVCGVTSSRLTIDPERATLGNLVDDVLKKQLGYGEELTVNSQAGTIYDPDLDDNLPKSFADLSVKADDFITIIDDEDDNPRVTLSLSIAEKSLPADSPPISLPSDLQVARKPKTEAASSLTNGNTNGVLPSSASKRKRSPDEAESVADGVQPILKKGKAIANDQSVVINDDGDGAITIDD
ncbi:uncharacterized protein KY384_007817 [Bacidia gigantensis]|uniref:uncharacterized protein n=1 Tax=Bacidia gigantensis TaxID=2732470 RepID=UPI001D043137|nr:uncharacterized protein KY384_007817 [Bacidia gigantensis]KAG8527664.1 hypothetical protein KY384_007817 [Bacidia gigantensis]